MVLKIESLDQLMLDFNESFTDKHGVTYYDFNKVSETLKEYILSEWEVDFSISAALLIPYKEEDGETNHDSNCIFLLREFKRGDGDDDVNYTYEYNGTISG